MGSAKNTHICANDVCTVCQQHISKTALLRNAPKPLQALPSPGRPWQAGDGHCSTHWVTGVQACFPHKVDTLDLAHVLQGSLACQHAKSRLRLLCLLLLSEFPSVHAGKNWLCNACGVVLMERTKTAIMACLDALFLDVWRQSAWARLKHIIAKLKVLPPC